MSGRESVALVARREISERIVEKSFVIGTVISLVVIACVAVLPSALGIGGEDKFTVAVQDASMRPVADAAVRGAGAFDASVKLVSADADATLAGGGIRAQEKPDDKLVEILQAANAQVRSEAALRDAGLDRRQAADALSPPPLALTTVEPVNEAEEERGGFAFVAVLLLYGQLISMGYFVAMGVVEEKSSRVVELLLSTLRPRHLLAGKILGLGLLGLVQLLLLGVVGLAAAGLGGALDVNGDVLIAAGARARLVRRRLRVLRRGVRVCGVARVASGGPAIGAHAADDRADGRLLRLVRRRRRPGRHACQGLLLHPAAGADDDAAADRARRGERGRGRGRARRHARRDRTADPAGGADLQRRGVENGRDDQAARRLARGAGIASDEAALGRRVIAGPRDHELVDLRQVRAHAIGHLVEDPTRLLDPAGR